MYICPSTFLLVFQGEQMSKGIFIHKKSKEASNYKTGLYCEPIHCKSCNKTIIRNKTNLCKQCINKSMKDNPKLNNNYIDGRSLHKYYCRVCKKEIAWQTYYYGKKHCQSCWQKGKNNPRYGVVLTEEQKIRNSKAPRNHHIDCNHKNDHPDNKISLSNSGHLRAHGSLNKLVTPLIEKNIIYFDRKEGIYKLTEYFKTGFVK